MALTDAPDLRYLFQKGGRRWTLTEDGGWGHEPRWTRIVTIHIRGGDPTALQSADPAPVGDRLTEENTL